MQSCFLVTFPSCVNHKRGFKDEKQFNHRFSKMRYLQSTCTVIKNKIHLILIERSQEKKSSPFLKTKIPKYILCFAANSIVRFFNVYTRQCVTVVCSMLQIVLYTLTFKSFTSCVVFRVDTAPR